jgi:hypothetical protein
MAPARVLALWILMLSGCATAPLPRTQPEGPPLRLTRAEPERPLVRVQLASDTTAPATPANNRGDFIGKRELAEARATLDEAKTKLDPEQWARLDARLTNAERSFERFQAAAAATGSAPLVLRGVSQLSRAGGAAALFEGAGIAASTPALALLVLLWPSETADSAHDHGPDWLPPAEDFKAKLRAVSQEAQRVQSELARRATAVPRTEPKAQPGAIPRVAQEGEPEWHKVCRAKYFECIDQYWTGSCYDCFRYCEGQHEWPDNMCRSRTRR